jgi:predicted membrane protein
MKPNIQGGLKMKAWMQRFMLGRYGNDDLSRFLTILAVILLFISVFTRWTILNSLAFILLLFSAFRMYSRNIEKRTEENYGYLRVQGKVGRFFHQTKLQLRQRKTHRFYRCPSCKQQLRVPKGKGLLTIHCPKCKTSFDKKT